MYINNGGPRCILQYNSRCHALRNYLGLSINQYLNAKAPHEPRVHSQSKRAITLGWRRRLIITIVAPINSCLERCPPVKRRDRTAAARKTPSQVLISVICLYLKAIKHADGAPPEPYKTLSLAESQTCNPSVHIVPA